jgi:cytochrome b
MTTASASVVETQVWDRVVRVLHWSLAASVLAAWATHDAGVVHEWIGYAALGIACLRVIWGFVGRGHARFATFVRGPGDTLRYALELVGRREARHIGHNPLGGWMIVALLAMVIAASVSGWVYTLDAFWGDEAFEEIHEAFADGLLALIGLHVAGVAFTSWRQHENLVAAMLHGRKRGAP